MSAYSAKALPYLNTIASAFYTSLEFRRRVLSGTKFEQSYSKHTTMADEQRAVRWRKRQGIQPFWANYFCGLDARCTCRIEGSKSLESDAIFFVRNEQCEVLAVHLEFKHRGESFGFGQPEGYPIRAACFATGPHHRPTVLEHDDWMTLLVCDAASKKDPRTSHFDKVFTHDEIAAIS